MDEPFFRWTDLVPERSVEPAIADDDLALGVECADPCLQIECWRDDAAEP